jgi:hypothetical protein
MSRTAHRVQEWGGRPAHLISHPVGATNLGNEDAGCRPPPSPCISFVEKRHGVTSLKNSGCGVGALSSLKLESLGRFWTGLVPWTRQQEGRVLRLSTLLTSRMFVRLRMLLRNIA